jgi:glutamine synthetase
MNRDVVERLLHEHAIELVRFETPDLNGVSRGKTVTADHFWSFVENGPALVGDIFCWDHECWVATGTGFGEDITFADLVMRPDVSTPPSRPTSRGRRVICDMEYADGRPVEASPRRVLQRQLEKAGRARADGPDASRVRVLPLDATAASRSAAPTSRPR